MDLIELENLRNNIFNELRNQSRIFKTKKNRIVVEYNVNGNQESNNF